MAKILLIEDDMSLNMMLKDFLEYEGFEVAYAFDGMRGLTLFNQEKPDLVLTDLVMPDQDGMGFLLGIMDSAKHFPCKTIVMSGGGQLDSETYLEMARHLGVNDVFQKPFELADLLNSIHYHLADNDAKPPTV